MKDFPEPPAELIAQRPLERRDQARLMVLNRADGRWVHDVFSNLASYFRPGEALVLNDVRVFPARLTGRKPTGGRVKVLLLKSVAGGGRWTALLTPSQKTGQRVFFNGDLSARVEGQAAEGEYELVFSRPLAETDLDRLGRMPLPPYIKRSADDAPEVEARDRSDYQTVFSSPVPRPPSPERDFAAPGAVAAPTAGLHFTPELLESIRGRGVEVACLRLDVGWGTFRPIQSEDYRGHRMLFEDYVIPPATAEAVGRAKAAGRRVWAVGTTAVRALESAADDNGGVRPGPGRTDLYIQPGHKFRVVDALVTNFHLPRHTPLVLAAAFAGEDILRPAYEAAVREKYRFFSYGDAMLVQ